MCLDSFFLQSVFVSDFQLQYYFSEILIWYIRILLSFQWLMFARFLCLAAQKMFCPAKKIFLQELKLHEVQWVRSVFLTLDFDILLELLKP